MESMECFDGIPPWQNLFCLVIMTTSVVSPLGVTIKPIIVQFSSASVSVGRAVDVRPLFVLREAMNTSTTAADPRTVLLALNDLFHSIFFSHLHLNPKSCKVLLVEPMLACSQWRDCVLTVLLRDFKVIVARQDCQPAD